MSELIFDLLGVDQDLLSKKMREQLNVPQIEPVASPTQFLKIPSYTED